MKTLSRRYIGEGYFKEVYRGGVYQGSILCSSRRGMWVFQAGWWMYASMCDKDMKAGFTTSRAKEFSLKSVNYLCFLWFPVIFFSSYFKKK